MQHYSILNSFSPIFDGNIKILIEILNGKVGETFNIYNYIEAAAAEIVCSIIILLLEYLNESKIFFQLLQTQPLVWIWSCSKMKIRTFWMQWMSKCNWLDCWWWSSRDSFCYSWWFRYSGMFVVGVKTLKPWYQNKLIMRLSKYHKIYNKSTSTIKEFVKKVC